MLLACGCQVFITYVAQLQCYICGLLSQNVHSIIKATLLDNCKLENLLQVLNTVPVHSLLCFCQDSIKLYI